MCPGLKYQNDDEEKTRNLQMPRIWAMYEINKCHLNYYEQYSIL